ncbi:MAG: serine/threonine protein kinase, partial [Anaerolineae bacterium]|nr:serine/threonine protein kinase [Anaerolineae bacterium]
AYQPSLDRYVAIKVLHPQFADDDGFVERFEQEAALVARLRHPNIVQVYDFDVEGDRYFMVMELIEGPTLTAELEERTRFAPTYQAAFSPEETVSLFTALANAVDYAHGRGMVHRDLKPTNIMFTADGQVVLTDFGIARMLGPA